jgi:hypothetical protein
MTTVAFSGGPGASGITKMHGGRKALIDSMQAAFPEITFLRGRANKSTNIILISNGVAGG